MSELALSGGDNADDEVAKLRKRVAILCMNGILNPPLESISAPRIHPDDSEEEKARKMKEHEEKTIRREQEQIRRMPELMKEMAGIIKRVLDSRLEPLPEDSGEYDFGVQRDNKVKMIGSGSAGSQVSYYCEECRNRSEENFVIDSTSGDTICLGINGTGCGNVISGQLINRGAEKRNFEGEEDRNHFGPSPDRLMTDAENMRTGMAVAAGVPVGGSEGQLLKKLSQTAAQIEMNLSKIGHDERRTRLGYKTRHKKHAFELMNQWAPNLNIHQQVIMRARQEFSRYRDVRETIQQFEGVVAACLVIAYAELMAKVGPDGVSAKQKTFKSTAGPRPGHKSNPLESDIDGMGADSVMGRWTTDEVKCWLTRVLEPAGTSCGGCEGFVRFICQHLDGKLTAQPVADSRKRKYDVDLSKLKGFGTTTMESRKSRLDASLNRRPRGESASEAPPELRAGKLLIGMDAAGVFDEYVRSLPAGSPQSAMKGSDSELVRALRSAIHRRVQFESARSVAKHEAELEASRLYTEKVHGEVSIHSVTADGVVVANGSGSNTYQRHHFGEDSPEETGDGEPAAKKVKEEPAKAAAPVVALPSEVVDMDSLFDMSSSIEQAEQAAAKQAEVAPAPKTAVGAAPKAKSRFKIVRQVSGEEIFPSRPPPAPAAPPATQPVMPSHPPATQATAQGHQLSREALAALQQHRAASGSQG